MLGPKKSWVQKHFVGWQLECLDIPYMFTMKFTCPKDQNSVCIILTRVGGWVGGRAVRIWFYSDLSPAWLGLRLSLAMTDLCPKPNLIILILNYSKTSAMMDMSLCCLTLSGCRVSSWETWIPKCFGSWTCSLIIASISIVVASFKSSTTPTNGPCFPLTESLASSNPPLSVPLYFFLLGWVFPFPNFLQTTPLASGL